MLKRLLNDVKLWAFVSLTLGLAPFYPEPHIWGKLKWIFGDPSGMQLMDWLDFAMHGIPWLLLVRAIIVIMLKKN